MYLFAFACLETDNGSGMVGSLFGNVLLQVAVGYRSFVSEGLVKFNDEVVLEVFGNSAAIAGGITDNLIFFGNHFDIRTFVESIHHDIRMFVFGESEAEENGTFCRNHFRHDIMLCKIYFIVVRSGSLAFMSKPTGTFFFIKHRCADYRHDRKLSVIINPRTGLVSLLETTNLVGCISILPSVSHFSCLGSPEVHSPRAGDGRIRITC